MGPMAGRMRMLAGAGALAFGLAASPAAACTITTPITSTLGPYSPAAVKAAAVPALKNAAGISCSSSFLLLLSGNFVRGKFTSGNALTLKRVGGTETIAYTASIDSGAIVPIAQGATVDYMQNNVLNLLGLLGSNLDLPFHIKPSSATLRPAGVYRDVMTINWSYHLCTGLGAFGLCVGQTDEGTGTSVVTMNLTVTPQDVQLSVSTATTWDPENLGSNPKAIPGSRRRTAIAVTNPDIVALDPNALSLVLPTPSGVTIALDGDGATGGAAIRFQDGTPSSALALRYVASNDTTDDVDFSSDGGSSWGYLPVAGNLASEASVTHVRVRPQGSMAKQSNFAISVPFLVK